MKKVLHRVFCKKVSIAQGRVLGLSLSPKYPLNICPKAHHYDDMGILRIKVADRIIE
jgi:hypothetical protein